MDDEEIRIGDMMTIGGTGKVFKLIKLIPQMSLIASGIKTYILEKEGGGTLEVSTLSDFRKLSFTEIMLWKIATRLEILSMKQE